MPSFLSNTEIKDLGKNLTTAISENRSKDALKILEELQKGVKPTEEVIRATKIGQTVAKIRSADDKAISQLAKDLVRTWKSKVDSQREAKKKDSPIASASPSTAVASPATPAVPSSSNKTTLNFEVLNDRTRDACLKLIFQSLEINSSDSQLVYERAMAIEASVLKIVGKGQVTGDYRSKVRSLTLNLKDKKNPALRANVVSGSISSDSLVTMTAEEMASEEQKAERNALQMQNLFNAKGAEAQEAETDAFECGKCKKRKCRYYQKQTRSADEPMTTFVQCTNCGNRWKFS